MENNRPESYVQRYLAVSGKLERLFFRFAMLGFIGILGSQMLMSSHSLRSLISPVDSLEGQTITNSRKAGAASQTYRELLIRQVTPVSEHSNSWIKINGVPVMQIGKEQVTVKVTNGDTLEIQPQQESGLAEFEIDHNDPAITSPAPGTHVQTSDSHTAVIGPVLFNE